VATDKIRLWILKFENSSVYFAAKMAAPAAKGLVETK